MTWRFGDPALPPLALAALCRAQPGDGSLFGALHGGAVAFAEVVESLTGHPATRCTADCKGLDLPGWDPRGKRGNALAYMTANVGASHMRAGYKAPTGLPKDSALDLVPELIESQNAIVVRDSLILCAFAKRESNDMLAKAWTATGDEASWANLVARACSGFGTGLERRALAALGRDAANEDLLSWRLRKEPLPSGVAKGAELPERRRRSRLPQRLLPLTRLGCIRTTGGEGMSLMQRVWTGLVIVVVVSLRLGSASRCFRLIPSTLTTLLHVPASVRIVHVSPSTTRTAWTNHLIVAAGAEDAF